MLGVCAAFALAGLVVSIVPVHGKGKPPKPDGGGGDDPASPVPDGVVYFEYQQDIWAMNPDGTGKTVVLPSGSWPVNWEPGDPSSLRYGADQVHDRWFLVRREADNPQLIDFVIDENGDVSQTDVPYEWELYAAKPDATAQGGFRWVRLTSTFGEIFIGPNDDLRWSNDGFDSFISFEGHDISAAMSFLDFDGDGDVDSVLDLPSFYASPELIYRLPVSGMEIETLGNLLAPFGATDLDALEFEGTIGSFDWSPDGQAVAVEVAIVDPEWASYVQVADYTTGALQWQFADAAQPRWAPDGLSIALYGGQPRGIWDVGATDSSDRTLLFEDKARTRYSFPIWSPVNPAAAGASTHFIYVDQSFRPGKPSRRKLVRVQADGSDGADLSNGLDPEQNQRPIRWVGNESAW